MRERDEIVNKYQDVKVRLGAAETSVAGLQGTVGRQQEEIAQYRAEVKNMLALQEELELKIQENKTVRGDTWGDSVGGKDQCL